MRKLLVLLSSMVVLSGCNQYIDWKQLELYRALRDGTITCYIHHHDNTDYANCIDRLFKIVGVK